MTDFNSINSGQNYFIQKMDKDNNKTVTLDELKSAMDRDGDSQVDGTEISLFALKAKANGFDHLQIKTMMGVGIVAEATLPLFQQKEGVWQASQQLKQLEDSEITTIPFSRKSIDSYDDKALSEVEKGFLRVQWQHGNSCGTTSLSTLMKYFQGHTMENNVKTIDKYTRGKGTLEWVYLGMSKNGTEVDGYTAPREIVNYANQHGMRAGMENNGELDHVLDLLDQGVPCLCLTEWNFDKSGYNYARQANPVGDVQSLHWVNVIGYKNEVNPDTNKEELTFIVANPHGKVQNIPYSDFEKVWSGTGKDGHEVNLGKDMKVQTGIQRLFVAMVPQDDEAEILKPDGQSVRAGDIDIPDENDGLSGKLASMGTEFLNYTFKTKHKIETIIGQLHTEISSGYSEGGIGKAWSGFIHGDQDALVSIRENMSDMLPHTKAVVINQLMDNAFTRNNQETLIYDLLKDNNSWYDINEIIKNIDTAQLARELDDDYQAGNVMAWIAKAETETIGHPGPKFNSFASYLAKEHREDAIDTFIQNPNIVEADIFHKIPAGTVRDMVNKLLADTTDWGEESTIYHLLEQSSWDQFRHVANHIDMNNLASELSNSRQLGTLTSWVLQVSAKFGDWDNLGEILTRLEMAREYTRADDVIGYAIEHPDITPDIIDKIPTELRHRMKNLVDDVTRVRTSQAVKALGKLRS